MLQYIILIPIIIVIAIHTLSAGFFFGRSQSMPDTLA